MLYRLCLNGLTDRVKNKTIDNTELRPNSSSTYLQEENLLADVTRYTTFGRCDYFPKLKIYQICIGYFLIIDNGLR